mmetsp:Transcript_6904/g.13755  ORF Transcript_6904/g.13755 Transcript_6904/m.13755 type:complete len:344 (+) Transcript_6904:114-1145(+)
MENKLRPRFFPHLHSQQGKNFFVFFLLLLTLLITIGLNKRHTPIPKYELTGGRLLQPPGLRTRPKEQLLGNQLVETYAHIPMRASYKPVEYFQFLPDEIQEICFHHIPKTGGTNFRLSSAFKKVFSEKWLPVSSTRNISLVESGHAKGPICPRGITISIIRDPVERYLSAYEHSREIALSCNLVDPKNDGEKCACCGIKFSNDLVEGFRSNTITIRQFFHGGYAVDNQMSRMLLGNELVELCKRDFSLCKSFMNWSLRSKYLLIGLSDMYENFVSNFERLFLNETSVSDTQYVWINRTVVKISPGQFSPSSKRTRYKTSDINEIVSHSTVDILLHDIVRTLNA